MEGIYGTRDTTTRTAEMCVGREGLTPHTPTKKFTASFTPHLSATITSSRHLYKGGEGRGEHILG